MREGIDTVTLTVDAEPIRATLDPRFLYLDRDRDDNEADILR